VEADEEALAAAQDRRAEAAGRALEVVGGDRSGGALLDGSARAERSWATAAPRFSSTSRVLLQLSQEGRK
jgi:hypothetical protein